MSAYASINYDEFFLETQRLFQDNLPAGLQKFTWSHPPGKGWVVVRYPQFKNSQYELHLSSRSKHHALYFGEGAHVTCAFYYRAYSGDRDAWIDALARYQETIHSRLGRGVALGPWSDDWVWIAENLDGEPLSPEILSVHFSNFVQATYQPVLAAFRAIGLVR
jgi:hypothetical protein